MFKEKYLIFRESEPTPEYAPKTPDSRAALSQEAGKLAENLTKPTAEQILINIFGANFEDAQIALAANYLPLIQGLNEDSQQLEYQGLKHNGKDFIVSWRKGGKDLEKTFSSYLPNMEPADLDKLALLFSAGDKNRAIERQVNEFCTKRIGNFLAKKGYDLSYKTFMVSYLVRVELVPILTAAYKQGTPYEFVPSEDYFTLKNQNKNFPEQQFDLADYDENFNLKNPEDHNVSVQQGAPQKDENPDIVIPEEFLITAEDRQRMQDQKWQYNQDREEIESYQKDFFPDEFEGFQALRDKAKDNADPEEIAQIAQELQVMSSRIVEKCPELGQLDEDISELMEILDSGETDEHKKEQVEDRIRELGTEAEKRGDHKFLAALELYLDAMGGVSDIKYGED